VGFKAVFYVKSATAESANRIITLNHTVVEASIRTSSSKSPSRAFLHDCVILFIMRQYLGCLRATRKIA
jgi:hypothetical protein